MPRMDKELEVKDCPLCKDDPHLYELQIVYEEDGEAAAGEIWREDVLHCPTVDKGYAYRYPLKLPGNIRIVEMHPVLIVEGL